ncbi:unknown; predicted coding region [Mycoplasmopsis pulmonis]|uniref:Uncharacterized protein n=1 Tax=Mycoplasmopsis pulmonis (strain UAB CTIP) TaxID=272635 RepID=Q98R87_MYCPU|nr:unknown; predicted coding region [Mycoplasmopsis pulmonis]
MFLLRNIHNYFPLESWIYFSMFLAPLPTIKLIDFGEKKTPEISLILFNFSRLILSFSTKSIFNFEIVDEQFKILSRPPKFVIKSSILNENLIFCELFISSFLACFFQCNLIRPKVIIFKNNILIFVLFFIVLLYY